MKVMFQRQKFHMGMMSAIVLCLAISAPAHSQNQDSKESSAHRLSYGLHFGFTENRVDLYYTQSGVAHALEQGDHSFYAPRFRIGTMASLRVSNYFSLRTMLGVSLMSRNWDASGITAVPTPSATYKVESACFELPVDVKFHPLRMGKWQPYVCAGLGYGFDFVSLRKDSESTSIQRLNAHDLFCVGGIGVDCDTRYLRIGVELKANVGLLSPSTSDSGLTNPFYFHGGPSFSIGLNIQA